MTQEEESRRKAQEVDNEVNRNWTPVYQTIARRMLSHLDESEALKVSTKESKEQVLSPNEPSVNKERIARQARSDNSQEIVPDLQQTRNKRDPSRQHGEMGGALENVDCAGKGMPGTHGNSALDRETRSVGYFDEGQDEYAESRT